MKIFYDTCALLNELHHAFKADEKFYISECTLQELEHIKTSASKDAETKFRARRLLCLLDENRDKYIVYSFTKTQMKKIVYTTLTNFDELYEENNDNKIMIAAYILKLQNPNEKVVFITNDIACGFIAEHTFGLEVSFISDKDESEYCGYKEIQLTDNNDEKIVEFYQTLFEGNKYDLLENEYLFVTDKNGNVIDKYKYTKDGLSAIKYRTFKSKMFGTIKPKDEYQLAAMDCLATNKIAMIRGNAGSGKSFLSFAFLFEKLEAGEIDKIVIFCNTVATSGAARLGFYPGDKNEKLLDSQIGNLLASKLGGMQEVERLIFEEKIVLLPMADIRGYDTSGMHAGVYISEAQNLDIELMKTALSRIGEDSICILDGDSNAQVDLSIYGGNNNGLRRVSEIFKGEDIYGEVTLKNVWRSRIAELAQKL